MASNIGDVVLAPMKVTILVETRKTTKDPFVTAETDAIAHLMPGSCQTRNYSAQIDGLSRVTVLSRKDPWTPNMEKTGTNQTFVVGPKAAPVEVVYTRVSDKTVRVVVERKYNL